MSEQWKPIPDFPGYEASDQGRIKSVARTIVRGAGIEQPIRERILRPHLDGQGRLFVSFSGRTTRYVHRLVLEAFVGPKPPGHECCHLDDDATNNRLNNLRWDSRSANQLDAVRNNRHANATKTHCKYGHEFTPDNVIPHGPGGKWRRCRTCRSGR